MISRRRLLTALALSPLLWQMPRAQAGAVNPHKVVALDWLPVELLLALGVTPYGVADLPNYRLWVNQPSLPASVINVGLRTEPNLELLTQMQPSFLVWSSGYGPSPDKFTRIAPGDGVTFSNGVNPLATVRESLITLAQRLGREAQAQRHLSDFDRFIEQRRANFSRPHRPLLLVSLLDARHMLVFGRNCLFQPVLDAYGLVNAWQGKTHFWGSDVVGIDRLGDFKDVDVLCFDHGNEPEMQKLMATPLWQALPFVRQQRFQRVPAVWFYGATLSVMHFVRLLEQALGERS
ncbi:MAG: Fe(3+)-hydroxamate ABC transporter substrate-binding protein FhuD [Pluralibacter sp.]|nr:Fe(3+)-hydroxamate ABC transporter substrate-binding protein FhuD [Pluralibacter sp.]